MSADAIVETCPEREMAVVRTGQIQLVGFPEHGLVAVGRRQPDHEPVSGRNMCSRYGYVSSSVAFR